MDKALASRILDRVREAREKRGDDAASAFANAVQGMNASQLQSDGFKDVRNLALATLGIGAAGRGAVGLAQILMRHRPRKQRTGPATLALPYPVKAGFDFREFLGGENAASKSGMPWYGPAMMLSGMAGLGAGWAGMDKVLDARRRAETEKELTTARANFHDALMSQYPGPVSRPMQKAASDLDRAFENFATLFHKVSTTPPRPELLKSSVDMANLGGQALGGYGMYAGLSGLLAGALIFDKVRKRSRGSILNKALQKRQRRNFMQSPTELYAVPEPVSTSGASPSFR